MNSKQRDQLYGVKPRNVAHTAEVLPKSPAKKPYSGYCKKLKGEHLFELANVKVYNHHGYPYGYGNPCYVMGFTNYKEYHCTACGKKRVDREEMQLDVPILAERIA